MCDSSVTVTVKGPGGYSRPTILRQAPQSLEGAKVAPGCTGKSCWRICAIGLSCVFYVPRTHHK